MKHSMGPWKCKLHRINHIPNITAHAHSCAHIGYSMQACIHILFPSLSSYPKQMSTTHRNSQLASSPQPTSLESALFFCRIRLLKDDGFNVFMQTWLKSITSQQPDSANDSSHEPILANKWKPKSDLKLLQHFCLWFHKDNLKSQMVHPCPVLLCIRDIVSNPEPDSTVC